MKLYRGGKWVEAIGAYYPNALAQQNFNAVPMAPITDGQINAYPLDFYSNFESAGLANYSVADFRTGTPKSTNVVDDPILGSSRKVVQMDADNTLDRETDSGITKVRAQLQMPNVFGPGHDIYVGFGYLFPSSFPALPASPSNAFFLCHQVYGYPTLTSPVNALSVNVGSTKLQWGNPVSWTTTLLKNTWMDFVIHLRLSQKQTLGFAEIWMNTGSGWAQQTFIDGSTRHYYATLGATSAYHWLSSQIQSYRLADMTGFTGSISTWCAEHRVADNLADAKPHSH